MPEPWFQRCARVWRPVTRAVSLTAATAVLAAAFSVPAAASPAGAVLRAGCPAARPGYMRCFAIYRAARGSKPAGLTPRQIQSAYRLPVTRGGAGQTVAVSIAYNAPHLAAYLGVYRSRFHLPACTVASGCLRMVNQQGQSGPLPASGVGSGWALEETLDVSMISVACPHCHTLVVEARSPSDASMAATDDTAARLGAQVISNSYGQRENGAAMAYAPAYRHRGHMVVAVAGDLGYTAAMFPASLSSVTKGSNSLFVTPRQACGGDYLCVARRGYDAPAGLGTPGGTGAF